MSSQVRAIGYVRVSTGEQVESGAGLAAQRAAIKAEADRRGWELTWAEDAGFSGKNLDRPALTASLAQLDKGLADVLVVSRLDRLSRSVADFGGLLERASKKRWSVVLLDLSVDTTTPAGELVANVLASAAMYERRLVGQRTREALAAKKAAGVRLGRPQMLSLEIVARVVAERGQGRSLPGIAKGLEADGVPAALGGTRWHPSTIQAVLRSQAAHSLQAEAAC